MGYKLIVLLALVLGVLYCIHLLVKDYQALTASRLLRLLFKRDLNSRNYSKPNVRWKLILFYDPIQCARYLFCDLGANAPTDEVKKGFVWMLSLKPREEDKAALEVFKKAHNDGKYRGDAGCKINYPLCPFQASTLFELIHYLLRQPQN